MDAGIRPLASCARSTRSPASYAPSVTCSAISSTTCASAASTLSRCARIETSKRRSRASGTSATTTRRRRRNRCRCSAAAARLTRSTLRRPPNERHRMSHDRHIADATHLLQRIAARHPSSALASSFGAEDMVLTDLIAKHALPIAIFTLDTGRLPEETYALIDRVREHYALPIEVHYPDARALEAYVHDNGVNGFYRSVEL